MAAADRILAAYKDLPGQLRRFRKGDDELPAQGPGWYARPPGGQWKFLGATSEAAICYSPKYREGTAGACGCGTQKRPTPAAAPGGAAKRQARPKAARSAAVPTAASKRIVFNRNTDAINGPPVVTENALVLGGNGRAMGLMVHYALADGDRKPAAAKKYLVAHAKEFGFSARDIEAIEQPVIVRVVQVHTEAPRELARLVRVFNIPLTQGMDSRAAAVSEARRLSDEALSILGEALSDDDKTLNEYLTSRASEPFLRELQHSGILTDQNRGQYLTSAGLLNDKGRSFVQEILEGALLGDARLFGQLGDKTRETIARGAPYLLAAASQGKEWDLRPAFRAAARDLILMRANDVPTVEDYLRQGSLISDVRPAILGVDHGRAVLQVLQKLGNSPAKFAGFARTYARGAAQNPRGQEALFAAEVLTPAEALKRAAKAAGVEL